MPSTTDTPSTTDGQGEDTKGKTAAGATDTAGAGNGEGSGAGDQINGLTADVKKLVENARKQEKEKLYPEIERLKAQLKEKEQLLTTLANKSTKDDPANIGKDTAAGTDGGDGDGEVKKKGTRGLSGDDLDKIISSAISAAEKKFKERLDESQNQIKALQQSITERDLTAYRDRLIAENDGAIIPEMVSGDSQEAIDQSLVLAKQAFARLTDKLKAGGSAPDGGERSRRTPPVPGSSTRNKPGAADDGSDVSNLSIGDYAKQRAALLAKANASFKSSP